MAIFKSIRALISGHRANTDIQSGLKDDSNEFAQPSGPPPPVLAPLNPIIFSQVPLEHQLSLPEQGWATVNFQGPGDQLHSKALDLIEAGKSFFDQPREAKEVFKTKLGSEEGWSIVEGEKELVTMRSLQTTPPELREAAQKYWAEASVLLKDLLEEIAESLGLPTDTFTVFSEPCKEMTDERTATMLRLFRYEGFEGEKSKIVAEAHRDLGLISLVIGDQPGLEVWDCYGKKWYALEKGYTEPAASLTVGRQLERLSNNRYHAGGHLVRSYPDANSKYRFSVVFVLRAHSPVMVDTDALTSNITGEFQAPIRGVPAGDLFKQIRAAHFNINTAVEEREAQRRKLAEKKKVLDDLTVTPREFRTD